MNEPVFTWIDWPGFGIVLQTRVFSRLSKMSPSLPVHLLRSGAEVCLQAGSAPEVPIDAVAQQLAIDLDGISYQHGPIPVDELTQQIARVLRACYKLGGALGHWARAEAARLSIPLNKPERDYIALTVQERTA